MVDLSRVEIVRPNELLDIEEIYERNEKSPIQPNTKILEISYDLNAQIQLLMLSEFLEQQSLYFSIL